MKKSHSPADLSETPSQESSKKLYRSLGEQAKSLDDARGCARNVGDLFTPSLVIQRKKVSDSCEKLIFSEPVLYGKKGEELLWRKVYYDVIAAAKKLKKREYQFCELVNLEGHLNAGVGFYHYFILKLQYEFNLNDKGLIDFAKVHGRRKQQQASVNAETTDWAKQSVYQCLIYLGDLSRYKIDVDPNCDSSLAVRYYLQAISYMPEYGIPYNQMGTLAMNQNHFLEAVYHYMRGLSCKFPFEGTLNNLIALFERNSKFLEEIPAENDDEADCIIEPTKVENIKRLLARFLLLIDIWYFDKKIIKVHSLCHQTYKNLEECLTYFKATSSESDDSPTDETDSDIYSYLNNDAIFKMMVISLLSIYKLQTTNSTHISTAIAFTLAMYSQLIQDITNHIQESVLNYPLNKKHKSSRTAGILKDLMQGKRNKSKSKARRRKAVKVDSEEESDASDHNVDCSSSDESFISDEEVLSTSSDEESDITKIASEIDYNPLEIPNGVTNGKTVPETALSDKIKQDIVKKVQLMDVNDMLEIIMEEGTLQSIKIINDWLQHDQEVLKSCGLNTRNLLKQITYLLNLININISSSNLNGVNIKISEIISKESKIPLMEDNILKGVDILKAAQDKLDWDYETKIQISSKQEAVIRIIKLLSFGKYLTTIEETGVTYDQNKNIFVCKIDESKDGVHKQPIALLDEMESHEMKNSTTKSTPQPQVIGDNKLGEEGQLNKMKHMGQLWLAAEVRALENRIGGKAALSPYLVLDADALIKYTFMVKNLVNSRKFIVLVPTAVVSALDDLKREKMEARDAIRWLESQFHRGNRFFRAQRLQERAPIPFIKYPKKKDKEMHIYIQIIECCYFLAEQQNGATNLVTLLIGNQNVLSNGENKEFSYTGLAQSVGIAIESITNFYGKWKKSKGKR